MAFAVFGFLRNLAYWLVAEWHTDAQVTPCILVMENLAGFASVVSLYPRLSQKHSRLLLLQWGLPTLALLLVGTAFVRQRFELVSASGVAMLALLSVTNVVCQQCLPLASACVSLGAASRDQGKCLGNNSALVFLATALSSLGGPLLIDRLAAHEICSAASRIDSTMLPGPVARGPLSAEKCFSVAFFPINSIIHLHCFAYPQISPVAWE